MKINRRLINIAVISLIIAILLTFIAYKSLKQSVKPEETVKVAYFKYNMSKGTVMKNSDLILKDTPISLVPNNAIRQINVENKTLTIDVTAGDFALTNNFISRGEVRIDVEDMYQLGIQVDRISNFLGTQLKEGEYYGLMYIDTEGSSKKIYKVKIVNMIDSTGKIVFENGAAKVDVINIAVTSLSDMKEIAEHKRKGSFELIKVPENKWEEILNNE